MVLTAASRATPAARGFLFVIALLVTLARAHPASAAEIRGRVVGITDGDTLTLLTDLREQVRVRVSDIDAPERRQPYGDRARQALSDLTFGRRARVEARDIDRYGRTVGRVFIGPVDVSAAMVERGAAWVFRQYSHDPDLLRLETEARTARRGLWRLPEAQRVAPWDWRHASRR